MTLSTIQTALMTLAFICLFLQMLVYWGQAAFFAQLKYKKLTDFLFQSSSASLTLLILFRWIESGHFPLSNLYESLLFLSWSFLTIKSILLLDFVQPTLSWAKSTRNGVPSNGYFTYLPSTLKISEQDMFWIGIILSPMTLLTFSFAFLSLPKDMQKATALVPALQSNWLMMHVTVMILSYATLLCGSILSIALLVLHKFKKKEFMDSSEASLTRVNTSNFVNTQQHYDAAKICINCFDSNNATLSSQDFYQDSVDKRQALNLDILSSQMVLSKQPLNLVADSLKQDHPVPNQSEMKARPFNNTLFDRLDNLSYRMLSFGFPLLTLGILSGAVWANSAWGSYWSWDPKETWALITWLVFAIYLHTRMTKGWRGEKSAIVAAIGFFVVWFCYLGVNLLGTGLHSYGWFSK